MSTVNENLKQINFELSTDDDPGNLLASIDIPVVLLGADLRVRRMTPSAGKILNLRSSDIGRPIVSVKLGMNIPLFDSLIREVLNTGGVRQVEVQDRRRRWYSLRLRPYRTEGKKVTGVVLVFIDVDEHKRSLAALNKTHSICEHET